MSTQLRKGIEIFATGTWNRASFTEADLDHIVEAFEALNMSGRVPLKLGHEGPDGRIETGKRNKKTGFYEDPMSQFSMGWVQKIYRIDQKLFADIEVSDKVAKLIDDKFLKFVSVELFEEVRASRRVFPWVLDAVALLGTDNPAVGILKDIQTLAMSARSYQDYSRCLMFARDSQKSFTLGARSAMAEKETNEDMSLAEQLTALSRKLAEQEMTIANLTTEVGKGKQAERRFTDLQAEVKAERVKNHRSAIKDKLEGAVKTMDITAAARDRFIKTYKVDNDDSVMDVDLEDVNEFIEENPNPKKPTPQKRGFSAKTSEADIPEDVPADQAMAALTFAQLREDGVANPTADDIERAALKVFAKNTPAKDRYRAFIDKSHGYDRRNG